MENIDWVSKRHTCSIQKLFETLKIEVQSDITTRNSLRPEHAHYQFSFASKNDIFTVFSESNSGPNSVKFTLSQKSIVVSDGNGKLIIEATVTLNNEGECRFRSGASEYESWQIRRKALEDLFFNTF